MMQSIIHSTQINLELTHNLNSLLIKYGFKFVYNGAVSKNDF